MQNYGAAKAILFRQHELDLAVINSDDAYGRELLTGTGASNPSIRAKRIISYGIDSGDVRAKHIKLHSAGMSFQIKLG